MNTGANDDYAYDNANHDLDRIVPSSTGTGCEGDASSRMQSRIEPSTSVSIDNNKDNVNNGTQQMEPESTTTEIDCDVNLDRPPYSSGCVTSHGHERTESFITGFNGDENRESFVELKAQVKFLHLPNLILDITANDNLIQYIVAESSGSSEVVEYNYAVSPSEPNGNQLAIDPVLGQLFEIHVRYTFTGSNLAVAV